MTGATIKSPSPAFTSETGVNACNLTERRPARLTCASVEQSFLPTMGIMPLLGRNFLPEEDRPNGPRVALISYGLWRGHYAGDASIVNRLIDIDGKQVRVIGVLPKDFEMPTLEAADLVIPQALDERGTTQSDAGCSHVCIRTVEGRREHRARRSRAPAGLQLLAQPDSAGLSQGRASSGAIAS